MGSADSVELLREAGFNFSRHQVRELIFDRRFLRAFLGIFFINLAVPRAKFSAMWPGKTLGEGGIIFKMLNFIPLWLRLLWLQICFLESF